MDFSTHSKYYLAYANLFNFVSVKIATFKMTLSNHVDPPRPRHPMNPA